MKTTRLLITLAIAIGLVGYAFWRSSQTVVEKVVIIGFQGEDTPRELPSDGLPDMRFHFLSPWQENQIPTTQQLDPPLGSENGALTQVSQKFWEMDEAAGGHHTGIDLSGIGGANTALGSPVFASGDGLVVFTGSPSPRWGNVLVLAHRDPKGNPFHTLYAHLFSINARLGKLVARGEKIGTVGTADGHFPAHLHFGAAISDGIDIGEQFAATLRNQLDPTALIAASHSSDREGISPSFLKFANLTQAEPWTTLQIKGAEKMSELKK